MKEIGVDSFTLYEFMYNHRDENEMFREPLLATCEEIGIRSHDHARATYTRELKRAGLMAHLPKKGWLLNPDAAKTTQVAGLEATVAELLHKPVEEEQPPSVPDEEFVGAVETSFTGVQLAAQIATQLLDRLDGLSWKVKELERRPQVLDEGEVHRVRSEYEAQVESLHEEIRRLHAESQKVNELIDEERRRADEKDREAEAAAREAEAAVSEAREADRKAERLQQEVARAMKEIAVSSGDGVKAAAERFLG